MDKNISYSDDESLSGKYLTHLLVICILFPEMEIALLTQSVDEVDRAESLRSGTIQLSEDETVLPPLKKNTLGKTKNDATINSYTTRTRTRTWTGGK